MAKASKRRRDKQKQKQLKTKRNWSLKRTAKLRKKPNKQVTSMDKILPTEQEASKFLYFKAVSEHESGKRVSTTRAKRLANCLMNSLSNTASRPVHFLCTCMLICSSTIHRSFDVVNRGKDNVHTAVSCSMAKGYSKIKKSEIQLNKNEKKAKVVGYVGDTVFPSRPYKRKLDEMSDRLEAVEQELKRLKSEVTNFSHQTSSSSSTTSIPTLTLNVPPPSPPSLPPPPPPPPPPVCKPPPVITFKKKQKPESVSKNSEKAPTKIGISLEELTSVKLRKVTRDDKPENTANSPLVFGLKKRPGEKFVSPKRGTDENKHLFITLKDIRQVSLRKTQGNVSSIKKRSPSHSKIAFLRHNLRKVETRRSPGGTPVNERRQSSFGEGLTPIMTRALQRKFQHANPPSPVDSFNETKSFLEKTFSQTSPRSPLTRLKTMR